MRIVSTDEMQEIEKLSKSEFGFDEKLIIENAGLLGANTIEKVLLDKKVQAEIIFLVGKGNNGADGMAMARHLVNRGFRCRAFVLFAEKECKVGLSEQLKMAKSYGVKIDYIDTAFQLSSYLNEVGAGAIVDCLFGTGVQLPLSNFLYDVIDYVNSYGSLIFSVDIPSGVSGDSGAVQGNAIKAYMTLAIGYPKLGHYISNAPRFTGLLEILNVGFPASFEQKGDKFLLNPEHMMDLVNPRDKFADKKVYGHSLVLGGSHGLTGAAALAAKASLHVGSGLVTVATWEPQYQELIPRLIPEIMTGYIPLDIKKWDRIIQDLNKYSSVVIGPGLARSTRARRLVLEVLNNFDGPVIVDADAINVLNFSEDKKAFTLRNAPTVLTPHFGEFAKFTGLHYDELKNKPVKYLKELVDSINCTVVLKGPCTFLGCTDGSVYFNYLPNDGMATGGAGDVLAGILGGLLGQDSQIKEKLTLVDRYEAFNRTVAFSIYLHSLCGQIAAADFGVRTMAANSLIESLPKAFKKVDEHFKVFLQEY